MRTLKLVSEHYGEGHTPLQAFAAPRFLMYLNSTFPSKWVCH